MHKEYLPEGFYGKLDHLVEECAEVILAAQKIQRFGVNSYHPHDANSPSNYDHLMGEIEDVKFAIERLLKSE